MGERRSARASGTRDPAPEVADDAAVRHRVTSLAARALGSRAMLARMKLLAFGWLVALFALACTDDAGTSPPPEPGEFGASCMTVTDTGSTECDSGVCTSAFDQLPTPVCSQKCTDSSSCPEGSEGKKCNMKGYCKP